MAIAFRHLGRSPKGVVEVAGRRIRVYDILGYTRVGQTPLEIAEDYRLPLAAVYEALAYAEDHANEMAAIAAREDAAHERALARVPADLRDQLGTTTRGSGPSLSR